MSVFTKRVGADFSFDPSRAYVQDRLSAKPRGFWLSVDGDWERWLEGEGLDGDDWGVATVAFDLDVERCLRLSTVAELDRFHDEYVMSNVPCAVGRWDFYRIDWAPLAALAAGIVIAPYLWERRLDGEASKWYYGWDAACACVWDLSAVSLVGAESSVAR